MDTEDLLAIIRIEAYPDLSFPGRHLAFPCTLYRAKGKPQAMLKPSQTSPARYVHLLTEYLEKEGIDCSDVLQAFALERATLAHPETQLAPLRALELFRALAAKMGGRSDVGLVVGKMVTFGSLGDVGRAMLSCANVRDALLCCAEFYPIVSPSFTMTVTPGPDTLTLRWVPIRPVPYDFLKVAFDMSVGAMDTLLSSLLGERLQGYDVYFTTPPPPHAALYTRLTRARCHFDVPGVLSLRMLIDNSLLDTPSPMHSPGELADLRKRLTQRLALTPDQGSWTHWVSMMLRESHGEQPTQDALAALVQVSGSTLARNLAAEGSNFRKLANDIRHQRACRWLDEGQMMVSDISARLGYADLPSFVRAFKAQSGCSPTQYARNRRNPAAS